MPRIVEPKVYLLYETRRVSQASHPTVGHDLEEVKPDDRTYAGFLKHLGVPEWRTDAWSDTEELIEVAGKSCYMSFDTSLNKNLTRTGTRNNVRYIQDGIIATKHGSVLEHASVTFGFVDVSRIFTHELVRHRAGAAYSQVSGRYVRTDEIGYFLPKVVQAIEGGADYFRRMFSQMEDWIVELETTSHINDMKDFDLKKKLTSAFRRVIGNGQSNHIIATFNHRAIRHLIELRTSRHAEEEIRHAFNQVYELVKTRYPAIYADAECVRVDFYDEITFANSKV